MNFSTTTPSDVGIEPQWLMNFLKRLDYQQIPLHSAIIMKNNQICMETYYAPYTKESLHRMFSITKTFVAMAIGLLCEEGKLKFDDHIVDYFQEKLPKDGAYPYTAMLTIKDMLIMRTCHNETTFKAKGVTDWVGSFFYNFAKPYAWNELFLRYRFHPRFRRFGRKTFWHENS